MLDFIGWFLAEFVSLPSSALPALSNGPGLAVIGARGLVEIRYLGSPRGPNSEFLEDHCTNRVEPYTIGKGLKRSTRQCHKVIWDMPSWGAHQDRIANFSRTSEPIVSSPIPLKRARKGVLGIPNKPIWDMTS